MRRSFRAFLAALLLLPLVFLTAGPGLAHALAGAAPHVCRCDAAHTDCTCLVCHPDLDEHSSHPVVRGTCGDRDVVFGATDHVAVLPSLVVLAPATSLSVEPLVVPAPHLGDVRPPEPPPPRA